MTPIVKFLYACFLCPIESKRCLEEKFCLNNLDQNQLGKWWDLYTIIKTKPRKNSKFKMKPYESPKVIK